MTVTLHGFPEKRREVALAEGATADDLLKAMGISRELVLVFRGKVPIPTDSVLEPGESVHVLRIVSGG